MQGGGSPAATQYASTSAVTTASQGMLCPVKHKTAETEETATLPNASLSKNITVLPLERTAWADLEDNDEARLLGLDTDDEALLGMMPWP